MTGKKKSAGTEKEKVAIVGGGIAGLFCALILSEQEPAKEVHLFEETGRLGGRIRSIRLNKNNKILRVALNEKNEPTFEPKDLEFHAEFGPMRVDLAGQKLLAALLEKLEIKEKSDEDPLELPPDSIEDFPPYASPSSAQDPQYNLLPDEVGKSPLDLLRMAIMRALVRISVNDDDDSRFAVWQKALKREMTLAVNTGESPLSKLNDLLKELTPTMLWSLQTQGRISIKTELNPTRRDQVPLFTLGFWNLISDHLSHDAVAKLRELGTFYHLIPENPNAAEWLSWCLTILKSSGSLKGIAGGMQRITEKLEAELLKNQARVYIHKGWRVVKLQEKNEKISLDLSFTRELEQMEERRKKLDGECSMLSEKEAKRKEELNQEIQEIDEDIEQLRRSRDHIHKLQQNQEWNEFDRIILALPKMPLEKVLLPSAEIFNAQRDQLEELLDSSFGFPLVKVFCVVKRRWWEEEPRANISATRVPTREIHYWKGRTKGSKQGLVMIYTDRPSTTFWGNYVQSGPHKDVAQWHQDDKQKNDRFGQFYRLRKKLARYLRENEKADLKEEDIVWIGVRDWGRDPYGGNHAWRPKRRYWSVMKGLSNLTLDPNIKRAAVHICGEAYSDYHGFMEGALRSAVLALSTMGLGDNLTWLGDSLKELDSNYQESLKKWIEDLGKYKEQTIPHEQQGSKPTETKTSVDYDVYGIKAEEPFQGESKPRTGPARAGAFLHVYAKNLGKLATFYEQLLSTDRAHNSDELIVLELPDFQLVFQEIQPHDTKPGSLESPSKRREAAIKLFFSVPSIEKACTIVTKLGGKVFSEWQGRGFRACNACDLEGNIFQVREWD